MIEVERMNGEKIVINPDLIKLIEANPDTVITFANNEKMILKTTPRDIVSRVMEYKRQIFSGVNWLKGE